MAPHPWDTKSLVDCNLACEQAQAIVLLLVAALGKDEPDPSRVRALFADLAEIGQGGELAASWCE